MRLYVVPMVAFIRVGFDQRLLANFWVVLSVPLLYVSFAHRARVAVHVVAGRFVFSRLRSEGHAEFGDFESAFRTLEAVGFRGFAPAVQPQVDRIFPVFKKSGMDVRHIAAIGPAQNAADGHNARRRLVPAEHEVHAANQMDEKISRETGAVFLPAAPTGEDFCIECALWDRALPGVPVDGLLAGVGWRRIFLGAARIIAAVSAFNQVQFANDSLREQFFCFGAEDGANALRADLHDAPSLFVSFDHGDTVGGRVRHRFFAVDVLAGIDRVDDYLLVPVIRYGGDNAIDFLVVEKLLILSSRFYFF